MKLPNNYFKVETKIYYQNRIHIEKDFFAEKSNAETFFNTKYMEVANGFIQNRYKEYIVTLAECEHDIKLTKVLKIRNAPQ